MAQHPPPNPSSYTLSREIRHRKRTVIQLHLERGRTPAQAQQDILPAFVQVLSHMYEEFKYPTPPNWVDFDAKAVHLMAWHYIYIDCDEEFPWWMYGDVDLSDPCPEYELYYEKRRDLDRRKKDLDRRERELLDEHWGKS